MRKYDVIIVGAGPAGIFTALELRRRAYQGSILLVEQGARIEKRACPKSKTKECVKCKPYCHITTGFSGAGAFSDGKLSLSYEVGGDLPHLIGVDYAQQLIHETDTLYLEFGADSHVAGLDVHEEVKGIRRRAIAAGLKLVDCPIRHLGTEKAQEVYECIQNWLMDHQVDLEFGITCTDLAIAEGKVQGVYLQNPRTKAEEQVEASHVIVATGRKGADWLEQMCRRHQIGHEPGVVDIGVRVEVRNEIMEEVNNILYESKLIGYPQPFGDKVRTFCQNPGGFVSQENYENDLAVVNGHSYKDLKSNNTNLAILCSHHFHAPFDEPIAYAKKVGELVNMLGDGHLVVQRFGDILAGKRTWEEELERSNVRPTLPDAQAGDISSAMPYRTMMNIIQFIKAVDQVVPGFAADETLLYAPELKFYSNRVSMDARLQTNIEGLHCLGDSSGWTRGLMMASVMGVHMARIFMEEQSK